MSRFYEMSVTIGEYNPEKEGIIQNAAQEQWPFNEDWQEGHNPDIGEPSTFNYGQGNLCGGESEEEFKDRLAKAIWKANKGFCKVSVRATYMEDLPFEEYDVDEEDYERLTGKKA